MMRVDRSSGDDKNVQMLRYVTRGRLQRVTGSFIVAPPRRMYISARKLRLNQYSSLFAASDATYPR
jgi:hypothetical protein